MKLFVGIETYDFVLDHIVNYKFHFRPVLEYCAYYVVLYHDESKMLKFVVDLHYDTNYNSLF